MVQTYRLKVVGPAQGSITRDNSPLSRVIDRCQSGQVATLFGMYYRSMYYSTIKLERNVARGSIYRTEVVRARDNLRARGINPSLDAIRVELGNTGSKSTIHRLLREIEEEEGTAKVGAKAAISEALQELVGKLAERLHEEADAVVAEARTRFEAQLLERDRALDSAQQEAAGLSGQLQRTETSLHEEKAAHTAAQQVLAEKLTEVVQLNERIAGLATRLAEHEAHMQSLEQKHQHAREALEHYRTSVKEQREQEQRRHEHQVQELQVALRQANEALTGKNHELVQLNRDNGQWLERHGRLERELAQVRQAADEQRKELDALRLTAAEYRALQARWAQDSQALEAIRAELADSRLALADERERREHAEADALRAGVGRDTLEQLLLQLRPDAVDSADKTSQAAPTSAICNVDEKC